MAGITDISLLQNPTGQALLKQLLAAYRSQQSRPLETLKQRRQQLQEQQKLLNTIRSKLEELFFQGQLFTLPGADQRFATRKVQSSHPDVVTAIAESSATLGTTSVYVHRLAHNDVLVSQRLLRTDPFLPAGVYRFELTGSGTTVTVTVTLDGTEDTEAALRKIATAINATTNVGAVATVLTDTPTTVRLSLTAKQTGSDSALRFVDTDGLLARLGWNSGFFADPENRTVFTETSAGYQRARSSELNAQLSINAITVTRQSNTISDLLPGVTLTLLRSQTPTESAVTLTTTVDPDAVAALIQKLLDVYNSALKELTNALNGSLKGDLVLRQLLSNLRSLSSQLLGNGALQTLGDIGIGIGKDGTLTLSDRRRLEQELANGSDRVAALFTSSGGFGERITTLLQDMIGSSGTLHARWNSIGRQLQTLSQRIRQTELRIEQQVEQYRKEYLKLQQLFSAATAQLGIANNFAIPSSIVP